MTHMQAFRIKDWAKNFENSESRKYKSLAWVPVKNKHDGKGYRRVVAHPKSVQVFCAFILMVEVASKMPTRGVLLDEDGPLTASDLAFKTGFPEHIFDVAFSVLTDAKIAWIEVVDVPAHPNAPGDAGKSPEMPGETDGELNRTELNRTEQTRIELKLHSYEATKATEEAELMTLGLSVLGEKAMDQWGGEWRNRVRTNPSKARRVFSAMQCELREGKKFRNPGGYANDMWKRFADT